jgi:hypothetical protein
VLESLIERTRIPDGEDVVLALAARPRAAVALRTETVNCTSIEISSPVPTISPSP